MLLRVIDLASDGLLPKMWSKMAPEGVDGAEIGRSLVMAAEGEFSYRYGLVVESEGTSQGGMINYPIPVTPKPIGADVPETFVPIVELVSCVPGYWYINFMAIMPDGRGKGLARALLNAAETNARDNGCPGLALIVAASNANAIRLYTKAKFQEMARCPFALSMFNMEPSEAILMVRQFD